MEQNQCQYNILTQVTCCLENSHVKKIVGALSQEFLCHTAHRECLSGTKFRKVAYFGSPNCSADDLEKGIFHD